MALTGEQVERFNLPTAPPKTSDTRTKRWTSKETCQLEALPPDLLASIVRDAILYYTERAPWQRAIDRERDDRAELLGLPAGEHKGDVNDS